jgi:hypothetical protein
MTNRTVHYVGFRGDEYARAFRVFGGPAMIHMVMDDRVMTEVGPDDIVVIGPKGHRHHDYVWDASAVPEEFTN